ncbi:MAG: hypothetical protein ACE15F_07840 [bacterium]
MKKLFRTRFDDASSISHEVLRRYLEGDLTPEETESVRRRVETSDAWRAEYTRVKNYLGHLHTLPTFTPPARVWDRIARAAETLPPVPARAVPFWRAWIPRFDMLPAWKVAYRLVPMLAVMAVTTCWMENSFYEPNYEVVTVDAANGFGAEAETYLAHHDLTGEPVFMKESLFAIYAHGMPK